jgi:hypothetical protein
VIGDWCLQGRPLDIVKAPRKSGAVSGAGFEGYLMAAGDSKDYGCLSVCAVVAGVRVYTSVSEHACVTVSVGVCLCAHR